MSYSKFIFSLIGIGCGLLLIVGSITKKSITAIWSKRALFFAGLCALGWGILLMIKITIGPSMKPTAIKYLEHYRLILSRLTLGILITLFISGELSFRKWKK
jgi:hypothetical protein